MRSNAVPPRATRLSYVCYRNPILSKCLAINEILANKQPSLERKEDICATVIVGEMRSKRLSSKKKLAHGSQCLLVIKGRQTAGRWLRRSLRRAAQTVARQGRALLGPSLLRWDGVLGTEAPNRSLRGRTCRTQAGTELTPARAATNVYSLLN